MKIIPAIMPKNFDDVRQAMARVRGFVPMVQIDAMDGKFVPNRSWPYYAAGEYSNDFLELIQNESGSMPFWEDLDFEADLMISEPTMNDIDNWVMAGAKRVILHAGSVKDAGAMAMLVAEIRAKYPKTEIGAGTLLELAAAYHVDTPIDYANTFIDQLDFIQCMGIAKVGFQSQPFDDSVLAQIRDLKTAYPGILISIDGGVNFETAPLLKEAGADTLVSGSAVFESDDIGSAIRMLENA